MFKLRVYNINNIDINIISTIKIKTFLLFLNVIFSYTHSHMLSPCTHFLATPTPNTETWCSKFLYFINKTNCRMLFLCSSWKSISHFPLGFLMPHQRVQTLTLPPKWCETASLHKRASKAVIRPFVELKSSLD